MLYEVITTIYIENSLNGGFGKNAEQELNAVATPEPTKVPVVLLEGIYDGASPISDAELATINDLEIRNVENFEFLKGQTHLINLRVSEEYADTVKGDIADLSELVQLEVIDLGNTNIYGDT